MNLAPPHGFIISAVFMMGVGLHHHGALGPFRIGIKAFHLGKEKGRIGKPSTVHFVFATLINLIGASPPTSTNVAVFEPEQPATAKSVRKRQFEMRVSGLLSSISTLSFWSA